MADGKLQGTVINMMNNGPLEGVAIQVEGGPSADSNQDGNWGPMDLASGSYNLTATKAGFRDGVYEYIVVIDDDTTEMHIGLQPAAE